MARKDYRENNTKCVSPAPSRVLKNTKESVSASSFIAKQSHFFLEKRDCFVPFASLRVLAKTGEVLFRQPASGTVSYQKTCAWSGWRSIGESVERLDCKGSYCRLLSAGAFSTHPCQARKNRWWGAQVRPGRIGILICRLPIKVGQNICVVAILDLHLNLEYGRFFCTDRHQHQP